MDINICWQISEMLYHLHTEPDLDKAKRAFLTSLRLLVPYSYASILMTDHNDPPHLCNPCCVPDSFRVAEEEYLRIEDKDHLAWLAYSPEAVAVCESRLTSEESRLSSRVYQECYGHYGVYDTLQMSMVRQSYFLGIVTLYRTREDQLFSDQDIQCLRLFSPHLNYVFHQRLCVAAQENHPELAPELASRYRLTAREEEVLSGVLRGCSIQELAQELCISEHTLNKHIQNSYRKLGITSRGELLKFIR